MAGDSHPCCAAMLSTLLTFLDPFYTQVSSDELINALSQQLDKAQAQTVILAPKLAAAEASLHQQQRHMQQLIAELEQAKRAQSQAVARGEVLQVLNVQLQAENMHLVALSGKSGGTLVQDMVSGFNGPEDQQVRLQAWWCS